MGGCSIGTYLDTCLAGAFPLALSAASSGEKTISSTWWVFCSEGPVCLGVLWVFGEDFLEDLVEGLMAGFEGGGGVVSMG